MNLGLQLWTSYLQYHWEGWSIPVPQTPAQLPTHELLQSFLLQLNQSGARQHQTSAETKSTYKYYDITWLCIGLYVIYFIQNHLLLIIKKYIKFITIYSITIFSLSDSVIKYVPTHLFTQIIQKPVTDFGHFFLVNSKFRLDENKVDVEWSQVKINHVE